MLPPELLQLSTKLEESHQTSSEKSETEKPQLDPLQESYRERLALDLVKMAFSTAVGVSSGFGSALLIDTFNRLSQHPVNILPYATLSFCAYTLIVYTTIEKLGD